MAKEPPNDHARMDMFVSSVRSYESFASQFEIPDTITLDMSGVEERDRAYWLFVMHAALLRKYVAPTDQLNLSKVIASAKSCIDLSNAPASLVWTQITDAADKLPGDGWLEYWINDTEIPTETLALDDLYGTHLHGDYDRWVRLRNGSMGQFALVDWVNDVSRLIAVIRHYWELAKKDGLLK